VDSSTAKVVLDKVGAKSNVQVLPGTYQGLSGLQVMVSFGDGTVPADSAMEGLPLAGDPVWVMTIDGHSPLMLGPTRPQPGNGIVAAVDGNLATLTTALGDVVAPYPAGLLTPADVGDTVKIMWGEGPFIIAVMSEAPVVIDPGAGDSPGGALVVREFRSVQAGSYRSGSGWWQPQVWASDNNKGIWGYGSQIPDTIPASAAPESIEIYISAAMISGDPPNFGVHGYGGTTGAPDPSYALLTPVAVAPGWISLPLSFANALKAGGGYVGVGVNGGGYSKFNSLSDDPDSGRIRIRYR
jgi:hypothetical protein